MHDIVVYYMHYILLAIVLKCGMWMRKFDTE